MILLGKVYMNLFNNNSKKTILRPDPKPDPYPKLIKEEIKKYLLLSETLDSNHDNEFNDLVKNIDKKNIDVLLKGFIDLYLNKKISLKKIYDFYKHFDIVFINISCYLYMYIKHYKEDNKDPLIALLKCFQIFANEIYDPIDLTMPFKYINILSSTYPDISKYKNDFDLIMNQDFKNYEQYKQIPFYLKPNLLELDNFFTVDDTNAIEIFNIIDPKKIKKIR